MQRLAGAWRRRGVVIGLVPTMGGLHAGHLSLVRRARRLAGSRGKIVLSVFVNPTQFAPNEDFANYPRDLARDAELSRQAGVDVLFVPSKEEMYPTNDRGAFSTFVTEQRVSRGMEGASRPTHFRGVTTVVAKLFNLVQPAFAVFGAKDYQQAAVIKQMVRDLNFPLRIVVAPIVREPDGLAMSSRNEYLKDDLRRRAVVLSQAISKARAIAKNAPNPIPASSLRSTLRRFIERQPAVKLDYAAFFDPETLEPALKVRRGVHLALAVFVGKTRLIDNARL